MIDTLVDKASLTPIFPSECSVILWGKGEFCPHFATVKQRFFHDNQGGEWRSYELNASAPPALHANQQEMIEAVSTQDMEVSGLYFMKALTLKNFI